MQYLKVHQFMTCHNQLGSWLEKEIWTQTQYSTWRLSEYVFSSHGFFWWARSALSKIDAWRAKVWTQSPELRWTFRETRNEVHQCLNMKPRPADWLCQHKKHYRTGWKSSEDGETKHLPRVGTSYPHSCTSVNVQNNLGTPRQVTEWALHQEEQWAKIIN